MINNQSHFQCLIILSSYHHENTKKLAKIFAEVLDAKIIDTNNVELSDFVKYKIIGFGSGIYDGHHHQNQLDLLNQLKPLNGKKAFIFSTTGAPKFIANDKFIRSNHNVMREKLSALGFEIIGEFGCRGWNTNSFLKLFGGLNKRKPDIYDLTKARLFAEELIKKC